MREFSTPAAGGHRTGGNLTDDVLAHVGAEPSKVLLRRRHRGSPADGWSEVTAADFHAQVMDVAKGLVAAGVQAGERVALLARTRFEWTVLDYAIWWIGAVTVPVYESSPADQVAFVLADSEAVALLVEYAAHADRVASVRHRLPALRRVWTLEKGAVEQLTELGAQVSDDALEQRRRAVRPGWLATIVYTSGTTGSARGCALTHGHLMAEVDAVTEAWEHLFDGEQGSTLLFLPLAHVFARVIQVGCIRTGTTLGHTADMTDLLGALGSFAPTFVLGVPRVFEKIYAAAAQEAAVRGRGRLFAAAAGTAIAWSHSYESGRPGTLLRARHGILEYLVYRRLRALLGGRVRFALSGGAPMSRRLSHFFRGVGVPVLEGYGLTETTAAVTATLPGLNKVGTVGRPLPGVTVRIADDGELLCRGPQVFDGYWNDAEATASALTGGWFHTGDLGEIDGEGFVRVTGRKNEILVTAGGKNVAPALLEDRIRAHPMVDHCLVVGDGRPYVAALVTLDPDAAGVWARANGRRPEVIELADDPDLRDEIHGAVEAANAAVSPAESVRRFRVLTARWTEEGGQLTPSLNLRRRQVMDEHGHDVDALYD